MARTRLRTFWRLPVEHRGFVPERIWVAAPSIRKSIARQINRWHLLRRAFGDDHEDERYLLIQAVVRRVPLGDAAKSRLSSWLFSRFVQKRAAQVINSEIHQKVSAWIEHAVAPAMVMNAT